MCESGITILVAMQGEHVYVCVCVCACAHACVNNALLEMPQGAMSTDVVG